MPGSADLLLGMGVDKKDIAQILVAFKGAHSSVFQYPRMEADDAEARAGRVLFDQHPGIRDRLFHQHLNVFGGDGQAPCFHQIFQVLPRFQLALLAADIKDAYLTPPPGRVSLDNEAKQDHQVGILIIIAPYPDMNPVFKFNRPFGATEDTHIKLASVYQRKFFSISCQALQFSLSYSKITILFSIPEIPGN